MHGTQQVGSCTLQLLLCAAVLSIFHTLGTSFVAHAANHSKALAAARDMCSFVLQQTVLTADVSYCYWQGVACCQTAGDFFSQYCSKGSQSVAQIFLTGQTQLVASGVRLTLQAF